MKSPFPFFRLVLGLAFYTASVDSRAVEPVATTSSEIGWPPLTRQTKPWSRWWWLGSAVNAQDLSRELERYAKAGLGGVEITPIYGVQGNESASIEYLSPQWMDMLRTTVEGANRLGMGVDMDHGTGWCFGGPNVPEGESTARVVAENIKPAADGTVSKKFDKATLQALVAFLPEGETVELTNRVEPDGSLHWNAGGKPWSLIAVSQRSSKQKVSRAAPGGEGLMLNPLYPQAMKHYFQRFTDAFAAYHGPKPEAVFQDSYEYNTNWAPTILGQFEKRRGYRLQTELPALFSGKDEDCARRVRSDFRETASDVLTEESIPEWNRWAHSQGMLTRYQAHGAPANLLDLYAVADVPETEVFGPKMNPLVAKFASSAAHLSGRNLVSSETGTWISEHFTETLSDLKAVADQLFLAGINRIVYHGTCYSPDSAAWPGWLFYASAELNPRNSLWRDFPALNAYIARCQAVLQASDPDSDLLIYWPVYDVWENASKDLLPWFSVQRDGWISGQPAGKLAQQLKDRGFTFDFISDRQLVALPRGKTRVILVPPCRRMPVETLKQLLALARDGNQVIFEESLPEDVPGFGSLEKRREAFCTLVEQAPKTDHVFVGDPVAGIEKAGMHREALVDSGLQFERRKRGETHDYFLLNSGRRLDGWVPLREGSLRMIVRDPMSGDYGAACTRRTTSGGIEVWLQMEAGASLFVSSVERTAQVAPWKYREPAGNPVPLEGKWRIEFIEGGPELPPAAEASQLGSWTTLGGDAVRRFAGTARYTLRFDSPGSAAAWRLNLGDVRQSARVRLNGVDLGTVFTKPFQLPIGALKPTGNELTVEVTGVAANRIRDLDQRKVPWRIFREINFVNIQYKAFDASNWPDTECGLLGPVILTPEMDLTESPSSQHSVTK